MVVDYYLGPGGANAGSGQRDLQPHPAAAPAAQPREEVEQDDLPAVFGAHHVVGVRDVLAPRAVDDAAHVGGRHAHPRAVAQALDLARVAARHHPQPVVDDRKPDRRADLRAVLSERGETHVALARQIARGHRPYRVSSRSSSSMLAPTTSTRRSTSAAVMQRGGASRTTWPRA